MADEGWKGQDEGGDGWWRATKNVAQTVDDTVRASANAVTFGGADRFAGAMEGLTGGQGYSKGVDAEVAKSEAARERSPYASVVGDVAGSVALPQFGAARLAGAAATRLAPYAGRAANALGNAVGYGVTGAGTGALQGAGNTYTENPSDYATNAGWGGTIGGILGAAGGAIFGRGPAQSAARVPDAAEQREATNMAYRALEANPAQYTPASFAQRADEATEALRRQNYYNAPATEGGSPRTFRTVEQMRDPPTAINPATGANTHITPADIDIVRKGVTGDRLPPAEYGSGRIVRRNIDDYLQNPPPGAVIPGQEANAALAARQSRLAHELHGGAKRSEAMEEMIRNAERQAKSTHSGLNLRNELQKAVKSGLKEKAGDSNFSKAGYSPAELAEFERFSRGQGAVSNVLGYADKFLGGGGGLGALAAAGLGGKYIDDNVGVAKGLGVAGAGLGLRLLGNRRATADINRMRDLIAQRNPLYAQRAANAPMVRPPGSPLGAQAMRDALTLELMKQTQPSRLDIDTTEWK